MKILEMILGVRHGTSNTGSCGEGISLSTAFQLFEELRGKSHVSASVPFTPVQHFSCNSLFYF